MKNNYLAGLLFVLAGVLLLVWTIDGKVSFFQWTSGERTLLENRQLDLELKDLDIRASSTDVILRQGQGDQLKVEVHGYSSQQENYQFEIVERGDAVTISYQEKKTIKLISFHRGHQLVIVLPDKAIRKIDVQNSSGDFVLESELALDELHVETSSGDVRLGEIHAEKLVVRSTSGNVMATSAIATSQAEWETSSGDIRLRDMQAQTVSATTHSGNVEMGNISAESVYIDGRSGNVEADSCTCDLEARLTSGNVEVDALAGSAHVEVSSGNVHVMNWDINGDSSLRATSGNVEVGLLSPEALTLDLKVNSGNMRVQLRDMEMIEEDNRRLHGRIGSGGPALAIQTNSGNIRVK